MSEVGRVSVRNEARAFAPGHITGPFVPDLSAKDPRARGSVGTGFVLGHGVVARARWDPRGPRRLRLVSRPRVALPISREVARRLRGPRDGTLEVTLEHALPVGQGFGMSAAGAVATALAVGELFEVPVQRRWEVAHLADLTLRGGLGGVAAIRGGGWERRLVAGVPPFGEVVHAPAHRALWWIPVGGAMPTGDVLANAAIVARIRREGRRALRSLASAPSLDRALELAERFSDRVELSSRTVRARIHGLREEGWRAAPTMFGNVVYAVAPAADPERTPPEARPARSFWRGERLGDRGAELLPPATTR